MIRFFSSSNFSALDMELSAGPFRKSPPRLESPAGGGRGRSRPFIIVPLPKWVTPISRMICAESRGHGREVGAGQGGAPSRTEPMSELACVE